MNSIPHSAFRPLRVRTLAASFSCALAGVALGIPVANNDSYSVNEDFTLNTESGPIISADFDTGGSSTISFTGNWDYLDRIQNSTGAGQTYPVDGAGRNWRSVAFDKATSNIGPWGTAAMPIQAGGINAFPGAPDILLGLVPGGPNTVTTYLFRNTFTLTPAQAAETAWTANLLVDDGCIIYLNGTEVARLNLPGGTVNTETFASSGNESTYSDLALNVAGALVAGLNTIAIELHQSDNGSSDVGLDLSLTAGAGAAGGFVYEDDVFGTNLPNNADGVLNPDGGFSGAGLHLSIGRVPFFTNPSATSGGFSQSFSLSSPTTVNVSLRYRLVNSNQMEPEEFGEAILTVDGTRYGSDQNTSLVHIADGGDSGWLAANFAIPLGTGNHTILLGAYSNATTANNEVVQVFYDDVVVARSGAGTGGVLGNDTYGANPMAVLLSGPSHGTVDFPASGIFIYTPAPEYFGVDALTYQVTDATGTSNTATVTITVAPVNDPPVAVANSYNVTEDVTLAVTAVPFGVLANDTDIENNPLTATLVAPTTHGSLTLNPNGTFTYVPEPNYFGMDAFTYRAGDGVDQSAVAAVTINVSGAPDAPTPTNDSYTVEENQNLIVTDATGSGGGVNQTVIPLGSVWKYNDTGTNLGTAWRAPGYNDSGWGSGPAELGYGDGDEATVVDSGPDGDVYPTTYFRHAFNVENANAISACTFWIRRDDGAVVYLNGTQIGISNLSADPDYSTYASNAADDGNTELDFPGIDPGLFVEGTNVIAVEIHQNTPSSSDITFELRMQVTRQLNAGLLANDDDPDGDALTASLSSGPDHGSVAVNPDGTFTYTPAVNFEGTDTFTYLASDGGATTAATATITITPGPNNLPVTQPDSYTLAEETTLTRTAANGVLANDSDPDLDPLTAILKTPTAHGALMLNPNGSFTYTPVANFFGADTFTYAADDGSAEAPDQTVTLNVTNTPDAPIATTDVYATNPGQALIVSAANGVLANDSDPDGTTPTAQLVTNVGSGTLNLATNGGFTYTPANGNPGSVSFTYRASDGALLSAVTTVTIHLDTAPVAGGDSYAATEDTPLVVAVANGVLKNDTDVENQTLSAVLEAQATKGTVALSANGAFTYTPNANANGADAFTYRANDGIRLSAPATVSLSVAAVNDAPVAMNDGYTAGFNQLLSVPAAEGVLFNDVDPDSTTLTASMVQAAGHGVVTLAANGSFTYLPEADYLGDDSFVYRTGDGTLFSSPATVTITVGGGGEEIVFSEIMYRPGTGFPENEADEWIELYNRGTFNVDLSGWAIVSGVDFTFPPGTSLLPGAYLVVAADVAAFQTAYPGVTNVVGGWAGNLSNNSNTLTIADPIGKEYDTVTYASQGEWATRVREATFNGWAWFTGADGGGFSLEVRAPAISNDNGQNWATSSVAGGTPGTTNTAHTTNVEPIIKAVKHFPAVPRSSETVLVLCELNDESDPGALTATLHWRNATGTSPGAFTGVPMSWDGGNGWFAPVPAQADLTVIEFYLSASDGNGTRTWPAPTSEGQNANCQYLVTNEIPSTTAETYHLVLTGSENSAFNNVNDGSDRQFNQTLIVTRGAESEIRYSSQMRIRGNSSRSYQFRPLRVTIPNDRDLKGSTRFNLNPKASHIQYAGMRLAHAVGLRVPDTIPVELRRNGVESSTSGGNTPDFGLWVRMEDLSSEMIDAHWPLSDGGQIYKKGRPDRFWRSTEPAPNNPDLTLDGWIKQSGSGANDWSDLTDFFTVWQANAAPHFPGSPGGDVADSAGMGSGGIGNWDGTPFSTGEIANLDTVADLNQWARWFAFMTIVQSNETNISNGQDDDYACYFAPRLIGQTLQRRMELIPHDLDTIFGLGDTPLAPDDRGLFDATADGDTFRPLLPLLGNNNTVGNMAFRAAYFTALREMLGSVFDTDTVEHPVPPFHQFIDSHLGDWAPAAERTEIKDFMDARRTYLLGLMAASAIPPATGTSNPTVISAHGTLMLHEVLASNVAAHANGGLFPDTVEIFNSGAALDLGGKSLTDDPLVKDKYVFPPGTTIGSNAYLIVYADTQTAAPGLHLGFGLNAGGDALFLYDSVANGQVLLDTVVFGLQIADYTIGRSGAGLNTWALCTPTIGAANTAVAILGVAADLRINEWSGNADYRAPDDFIELYNPSPNPTALGGMVLTDDFINYPGRGVMPRLSFVGPGSFTAFFAKGSNATPGDALELPYNIDSTFGSVALLGANGALVDRMDTVSHFRDVSMGRVPDGSVNVVRLGLPSPGATNGGLPANSVNLLNYLRVTEMMFHPLASTESEYVEFRNTSDLAGNPVTLDLGGISFGSGLTFTFPGGTMLAAGQHLVIVEDAVEFQAQFPAIPVGGVYDGKLDNGGERLRFDIPGGLVAILDFTYADDWYPSTDGEGYALQIVDPAGSPARWDQKSGWQAALPSPGSLPAFGVSAGADTGGAPGTPVLLDGAIFLGPYTPSQISVAWTLVSGPGSVNFTTGDYQDANGLFTVPGVYTVRITATSPGGSASDTTEVTIGQTFDTWAAVSIPIPFDTQRGPFDDPDLDGYVNALEFALGSDPLVPGLPIDVRIEGGRLIMDYTRSKGIDPSVQLIPEISWDLATWYSDAAHLTDAMTGETASLENRRAGEIGLVGSTTTHCSLRLRVILP